MNHFLRNKIVNPIRAFLSLARDKNCVELELPEVSKPYIPKALFPYFWFAAMYNWDNYLSIYLSIYRKIYVWRPTYAVLNLEGLTYDEYFSHHIRSAERALIRKAEKNGFVCKQINYDDYLDEILEINTSKTTRQGGEMTSDYTHVEKRDAILSLVDAKVYNFGCFSETGKLVAYYTFEKITNFYHVAKGIGHSDYLKYGIMNALFAYSVSQLSTGNGKVKYVIYGTCTEKAEAIFRFKRNVGCKVNHLMIKGNKEQIAALQYFRKTYICEGDGEVHYVKDYVLANAKQ